MYTFLNRKLTIIVCLAFGGLCAGRAQVQPLPVIPPDALVQTFTGRLAQTLLNDYVRHDDARLSDSRTPKGAAGGDLSGTYPNPTIKSSVSLTGSPTAPTPTAATNSTRIATTAYVKNNLANYVTTSDSRLSDSRTPTGTAGGDLSGTYPNPTIKSSVSLTGNPTVEGQLTVNGTGENLIKGNLRLKGNGSYGNKLNFGDGDYVYLQEEAYDNLTIKAQNIDLAPTTAVTAPTPAKTDSSTRVATTAYVKNNLNDYIKDGFIKKQNLLPIQKDKKARGYVKGFDFTLLGDTLEAEVFDNATEADGNNVHNKKYPVIRVTNQHNGRSWHNIPVSIFRNSSNDPLFCALLHGGNDEFALQGDNYDDYTKKRTTEFFVKFSIESHGRLKITWIKDNVSYSKTFTAD